MLFNSFEFLVFLPAVVLVFFLIPQRFRWIFLLAASYYFYMCWKAEYLFLIVASTLIDYFAALRIHHARKRSEKKALLALSVAVNLGILFAFKYLNFFSETTRAMFQNFNVLVDLPAFNWLLPVGISFYTFQSMSYTIDVYRGERPPEKNLGIFALYVSFFPQLVAGPIERSSHLIPQFSQEKKFDSERTVSGLRLIAWGFFKKVVLADRMASFVDNVFSQPHSYEGLTFLLAGYFFTFQIYCDFSGYTDIARGSAKLLGFDLMKNFRAPFLARSIVDFWKRWHISLTSWFRDYLYIPLGGNRSGTGRWVFNISAVFILSGLWHGAAWTFVFWGAYHAVLFSGERVFLKIRGLKPKDGPKGTAGSEILKILITFHLVMVGFIFFRAETIGDGFFMIRQMLSGGPWTATTGADFSKMDFLVSILGMIFLILVEWAQERKWTEVLKAEKYLPLRWAFYYFLIFGTAALADVGSKSFIYFQF